eukprot:1958871-Rhodomonas_salina.3
MSPFAFFATSSTPSNSSGSAHDADAALHTRTCAAFPLSSSVFAARFVSFVVSLLGFARLQIAGITGHSRSEPSGS